VYAENLIQIIQQSIVVAGSIVILYSIKRWIENPVDGDEKDLADLLQAQAARRLARQRELEILNAINPNDLPLLAPSRLNLWNLTIVEKRLVEEEVSRAEFPQLIDEPLSIMNVATIEQGARSIMGGSKRSGGEKNMFEIESKSKTRLSENRGLRIINRLPWRLTAIALVGLTIVVFVAGCNPFVEPPQPTITPEPTLPPPPTTSGIGGVVWHDLCSNFESGDFMPLGCVASGDEGGFVANAILEEGEMGIQGAQVSLGEGVCPSTELMTATTGSDGRFSFLGLSPGIYCVSVDQGTLIPGILTYPEKAGSGSITVALGEGQIESNINFGWDYMLLPPTSDTEPQDTPIPSPACIEKAVFVKDVTIPDDTYLDPEEAFEKVWRIKNSGTCIWTPDYSLVFVSGYSMGGPASQTLLGDISPQSVVDLHVDLKAPKVRGSYKGLWMIRNPEGVLFGIGDKANQPFWVQINVGPEPVEITDWRGEYYDNRELKGKPVLVRNDEKIDFNWKKGAPAAEVPEDNFSARWTQKLIFDAAIYRFSVRVDDGVRLIVDDRVVINEWEKGAERLRVVDLLMSKGEHQVALEYFERGDQARIQLSWEKITDSGYSDWRGEYWFSTNLDSDFAIVRNDAALEFDWGRKSPLQGIPSDEFSARWVQQHEFEPGVYRFYARSDDGIRAYLDNNRFLDEWHVSSGSEVYTADLTLSGTHWLKVEYNEKKGDAKIKFWWELIDTLNDPPGALDDAYSVAEGSDLVVAAPGVLENDVDVDGDPLAAVYESGPSNGELTLNEDGSFVYTPNSKFNGTDSFTYKASDGRVYSNGATVTITVNPANDLPQATDDDVETQEDTPIDIDVLANDIGLGDTPISLSVAILPENGVAEVAEEMIRYTPGLDFCGEDSFSYTVIDADGENSTATVKVTVRPVNDPPIAADDTYSVDEDGALSVEALGVLENDSDAEGELLSALLETDVSNGTLVMNTDGSFTYIPTPEFHGTDTFTYKAGDGSAVSNLATVVITVSSINDVPLAENDSIMIEEIVPIEIDVLSNDTGLGDVPITIEILSSPNSGSVEILGDQVLFTPSEGFTGKDSFTYRVTDVDGESSEGTVTVLSGDPE
jgi:VCBS repeat-containing protein